VNTQYDDDPTRNDGGQYLNHFNANVGEQWIAGVNKYDSYQTAHLKTEAYRRSRGLDPYTGFVPLATVPNADLPYPHSSPVHNNRPDTDPRVLPNLGRAIKLVILWPTAIIFTFCAVLVGLLMTSKSLDGATLTARAAKNDFSVYQPVPLASRFTQRELDTPITPESILKTWRALQSSKASTSRMLPAAQVMGQAYRCMLQEGCRESLAKLDTIAGANLPVFASGYLKPLVEKGDESAARDMCLFAVKTGISYKDMMIARALCARVNSLNTKTKANIQALAQLDGSWAMRRALIYGNVDRAYAAYEIRGFSGVISLLAL
jgi:hypothetical protein